MIGINTLPKTKWKDYKRLRLEALKKEPNAFCSSYNKEAAFTEKIWKGRTKNALFLFIKERPVGMIVIISGNKKKRVAEIFGFYVRKSHRNRGYGKMLVDKALSLAKNSKNKKVRLWVASTQKSAIFVYKTCGFKIIQKEKDKEGLYLLMERCLI